MKLKNVLFSVLFVGAFMIGSTANAQLRFGLRGEVGINKPSVSKSLFEVENMNAFKVGPTAEFTLPVVGLAIDGSLLYSNQKMNIKTLSAKESSLPSLKKEITEHYIDIPVNVKYKMGIISPVKAFVAAGPYIGFRVGGDELKLESVKETIDRKKFEAGLNFGFGAEIISRVAVGFNYRLKLTDDYSVNQPELKDLLNDNKGFWTLTAAVYF